MAVPIGEVITEKRNIVRFNDVEILNLDLETHFIPAPICFRFHLVDFLVDTVYDADGLSAPLPYAENQNR